MEKSKVDIFDAAPRDLRDGLAVETQRIRLILVDDDVMLRCLVAAFLERPHGIRVVGEADNGRDTIALTRQLRPDIVLLAVALPVVCGQEVAREIRRLSDRTRIIAMSRITDPEVVGAMIAAGISGYIVKTEEPYALIKAIRSVFRGQSYFSPEVSGPLMRGCAAARSCRASPSDTRPSLAPREHMIVKLVADGYTSKDIAVELGMTEKTVTKYREQIRFKLGLNTIAAQTKYAIRMGLTSVYR